MMTWKSTSPVAALTLLGVFACSGSDTLPGNDTAELSGTEAFSAEGTTDLSDGAVAHADSGIVADLIDVTGEPVGTVIFSTDSGSGSETVQIHLNAHLPDLIAGPKGLHVHDGTECTPPTFETAGDHFDPLASPHGDPSNPASARHVGDLGNVVLDELGYIRQSLEDALITLDMGPNGILGRVVVLHDGEDDYDSQPSGESGDPAACGVIESRL